MLTTATYPDPFLIAACDSEYAKPSHRAHLTQTRRGGTATAPGAIMCDCPDGSYKTKWTCENEGRTIFGMLRVLCGSSELNAIMPVTFAMAYIWLSGNGRLNCRHVDRRHAVMQPRSYHGHHMWGESQQVAGG